ncbi:MAG: M48 family metalloprotease [Herminiimonas sp.]|nr:M48 family metalloprotease [Herminiimonas sp.]
MHRLLHAVSKELKQCRFARRGALLPVAVLMAACATPTPVPVVPGATRQEPITPPPVTAAAPEPQGLRTLVAYQDRLYRVAAPLLVNGTTLCKGNARKLLGFTAKNKYSYPAEFVELAQRQFGFDDRLRITSVLPKSGAAKAGIRAGDILVAVEDKPMPQGENAERQVARILSPLVTPRAAALRMTVNRNGANIATSVPLTVACAFAIELGNAENVNAYGDGRRVLITRGMMNFAKTDDELAYVLAKELAHSALGHASRQKMNATMGGIIDNLIRLNPDMSMMGGTAGVRPLPQELDAAADNLALYFLARADYDPAGAPAFWQRLATAYPASVANGYTAIHPSTAYRLINLDKNLALLKTKQDTNATLMP